MVATPHKAQGTRAWFYGFLVSGVLLLILNLRVFYMHPLHLDKGLHSHKHDIAAPSSATATENTSNSPPAVARASSLSANEEQLEAHPGTQQATAEGTSSTADSRAFVRTDQSTNLDEASVRGTAAPPLNQTQPFAALLREQALHATQGKGYLAMCLVARDMHRDIREWVFTHLFMGVEKIYLNDHHSDPWMSREVEDFIALGLVEYRYFGEPVIQHQAFPQSTQGKIWHTCIERAAGQFRWMAFIDADEFIMIRDDRYSNSIPSVLKMYEAYPGIALPWMVYGSSGLESRSPHATLLRTFTKCGMPLFTHLKVIAQLSQIKELGNNPHEMAFQGGAPAVTENLQQVRGPVIRNATADILAIAHFMTRSKTEYRERVRKYTLGMSGWVSKKEELLGWADGVATGTCLQGVNLSKHIESRLLSNTSASVKRRRRTS